MKLTLLKMKCNVPFMKRYGQACAIARALDIVGERWNLLIVRELTLGPRRGISIRPLATAGGLSPSRVHQLVASAGLDALDAAPGELRAVGRPAANIGAAGRTTPN